MIRRFMLFLYIMIGTLCALFGMIYCIWATNTGLKVSLYLLKQLFIPGQLTVASISGTLKQNLRLDHIHYQSSSIQITIKSIQWNCLSDEQHHLNFILRYQKLQIQTLAHSLNAITAQLRSYAGSIKGHLLLAIYPILTWQATLPHNQLRCYDTQQQRPILQINSQNNDQWDINGQWHMGNNPLVSVTIPTMVGQMLASHIPITVNMAAHYDHGTLMINPIQLNGHQTHIKLTGMLMPRWALHWVVHIPDLHLWTPLLQGRISSIGDLRGSLDHPQLRATFTAQHLTLSSLQIHSLMGMCAINLDQHSHAQNTIQLSLKQFAYQQNILLPSVLFEAFPKQNPQKLLIPFHLILNPNNQIIGKIRSAPLQKFNTAQPIYGDIRIQLHQLSKIIPPTSAIQVLKGAITGQLKLKGELAHPLWTATLHLDQGETRIKSIDTVLQNINLKSTIDSNHTTDLNGTFTLGKGTAEVQSRLQFNPTLNQATLQLNGKNLQIANTQKYKITVSPELVLNFTPKQTQITGRITIPHATVSLQEVNNLVTLPPETLIIHDSNAVDPYSDFYRSLVLNIKLYLASPIDLSYPNLTTKLAGALLITKYPGSLPIGVGELHTLQGKYQIYGKSLLIQTGRLLYTGNALTNPGLSIRAIQKFNSASTHDTSAYTTQDTSQPMPIGGMNQTIVGITVTGTLNHPIVSLFSNPMMSQNDMLSYLLFGYPAANINNASSLAILNQFIAQNTAHSYLSTLQKTFSLNELGLGSTDYFDPNKNAFTHANTLNIGKKLHKNLYLSYSTDIRQSLFVLRLRYKISPHFSLQAESSSLENGTDLFYEFTQN